MAIDYGNLFDEFTEVGAGESREEFFADLPNEKGVIVFADERDRPVQLVTAGSIRRTARAKLERCEDEDEVSAKADISRVTRSVGYKCCYCDFVTGFFHYRLARELFGGSYRDYVTLPRSNYVRINRGAYWPSFEITSRPFERPGWLNFGPFISRRSAGVFLESLVEGFGLCRRADCLGDAEKAAACPYLQMNQCAGPCVGRVGRDEYLAMVDGAVRAAGGEFGAEVERLEARMRQLSEQMQFEQAGFVKKRIGSLSRLSRYEFKWVRELGELSVLHVDLAERVKVEGQRKKRQKYQAVLVKSGHVYMLGSFLPEDCGGVLSVAQGVGEIKPAEGAVVMLREQLAMLAYYLYRSKSAGIFVDFNEPISAEQLQERIGEVFEG